MTVSSGKPKSRPPAHQNSYGFRHNKSSKLTTHILSLPLRDLCPSCRGMLEWRKKFRKYKPLTVVKKCTGCGKKSVKDAYHVICAECVVLRGGICSKCLLPPSQWKAFDAEVAVDAAEVGDVEDAEVEIEDAADVAAAEDMNDSHSSASASESEYESEIEIEKE